MGGTSRSTLGMLGRGKFELSPTPKKKFGEKFQKTLITNKDTKMDFKQPCSQFILPYDKVKLMLHNLYDFVFLWSTLLILIFFKN